MVLAEGAQKADYAKKSHIPNAQGLRYPLESWRSFAARSLPNQPQNRQRASKPTTSAGCIAASGACCSASRIQQMAGCVCRSSVAGQRTADCFDHSNLALQYSRVDTKTRQCSQSVGRQLNGGTARQFTIQNLQTKVNNSKTVV